MSQVKDAAPARMKPAPMPSVRQVSYGTLNVDGLGIAYREAGRPDSPKLVLLHGFPASSHQYRDLVPALADRFHVIAPDYPGFGLSERPDPQIWAYTFDHLSEVIERFLQLKGFSRYGLYVQDYGGPVAQSEAWIVRSDHVESVGQGRDEVAVLVRTRGEAVQ